MNLNIKSLAVLLWTAWLPCSAWAAGLTWSASDLAIKADPKKPTAEAVYAFKNESVQTVVIKSAAACCDCVQIGLVTDGPERRAQGRALQSAEVKQGDPVAVSPGESGELRATFHIGARTGRHEKAITVTYLDERVAPSVLKLAVDIPEAPVRLSAETLRWKQGGAADQQTVDIILADKANATIDSVQCAEPNFVVSLEPAKAPASKRLVVKPTTTERLGQGMVRIQATVNGAPQVLLVQAIVR
jgi:hypothetical protein